MAIEVKIYTGVVAKWSSAQLATHVAYSVVEFESGKRVGDFKVAEGLSDIFEAALEKGRPLSLHIVKPIHSVPSALLAVGEPGGELFATDVPPLPGIMTMMMKLCLVFGILFIPVFGIGFIIIGKWIGLRGQMRPLIELREYVRRLPNATLVTP